MDKQKISIFWFRRDLRLHDNRGLSEALKSPYPVLPLFIFDTEIIDELENDDPRISFIYDLLENISNLLAKLSSSILLKKGRPEEVWKDLQNEFDIQAVYANEDYEPYAIQRDLLIENLLKEKDIPLYLYKDQVIFAKDEILKQDNTPYTVFTPYKNKWLSSLNESSLSSFSLSDPDNFVKTQFNFPALSKIGFKRSSIKVLPYDLDHLENYDKTRNYPALNQTSKLGPHLRFGSVSIREVASATKMNDIFLSELIWREFFMQILFHFPQVLSNNFKTKYDGINWRNNSEEFEFWKAGETGYPIVDAGMRELNSSGYMHNRVRMIVAGFLCKHLLIDWRWGEAYFAEKLLDYELSSNNGNWQWAAGTGCDAAPYFRIFNPSEQTRKFDNNNAYIRQWIPASELHTEPVQIVEHKFARERAIRTYKEGILK